MLAVADEKSCCLTGVKLLKSTHDKLTISTCAGAPSSQKDLLDLASSEGASSALQDAEPDLLEHFLRPPSAAVPRHLQLASVWEEAEVSGLLWQTLVKVDAWSLSLPCWMMTNAWPR